MGLQAEQPMIVLASSSQARATMLRQAGVACKIQPSGVGEDAIKQAGAVAGKSVADVAAALARAKADAVAASQPKAIVIAADQMLECAGRWYNKPRDLAEARARLLEDFSGRDHRLIAAVAVIQGDRPLLERTEIATLHMRTLTPAFVDSYLAAVGEKVCRSIGAYQLEGFGALLFERVEGDFFTILGMPLLPVLDVLRRQGVLLA